MDVVMFDPRKHWGSGKGVIVENASSCILHDSTFYRTPMFTWTKHNDIHAFSMIAPFTEPQCLRGQSITTSMHSP
jgi:hypothetical protein